MTHATDTRPLVVHGARALSGRVQVPGDKSISHRSLIFGGLAIGETVITGLLEGEDVINTAKAMRAMGADVTKEGAVWVVRGRGTGGLTQPPEAIDFGNSGTGVRLMMGVIAGHPISVTVTGDASLSRRPMGRVLTPLQSMGLEIDPTGAATLPLTLKGSSELIPVEYELPVASAQVKSAVLLAGLMTRGTTTVIEPVATRDHTERMLTFFGADISVTESTHGAGRRISLTGPAELRGQPVRVPGDPSSAAFLAAAAVIVEGSDILIENVLTNPSRIGFYTTLQEMGADLSFENAREAGGEPVADIRVRASALRGIKVPADRAPSMIDEYPVLAAVAAFAEGE
ncbi:MAG: 3-phosphoshikimate 1-carboxyvinyltransferase, partial [Pseudomonadota bacterium]